MATHPHPHRPGRLHKTISVGGEIAEGAARSTQHAARAGGAHMCGVQQTPSAPWCCGTCMAVALVRTSVAKLDGRREAKSTGLPFCARRVWRQGSVGGEGGGGGGGGRRFCSSDTSKAKCQPAYGPCVQGTLASRSGKCCRVILKKQRWFGLIAVDQAPTPSWVHSAHPARHSLQRAKNARAYGTRGDASPRRSRRTRRPAFCIMVARHRPGAKVPFWGHQSFASPASWWMLRRCRQPARR